jgi:hypothetical protein
MKELFFYLVRTPIYVFRVLHVLAYIIWGLKFPKSATFKINTGSMAYTRIYPLGVGLFARRNYKKEPKVVAKKAWHYPSDELWKKNKYPIIVWVL